MLGAVAAYRNMIVRKLAVTELPRSGQLRTLSLDICLEFLSFAIYNPGRYLN